MRWKKQKHHRKAVKFYAVCYGFRKPFKVLCDGTFIHHLVQNKISPADKAISNILGGPVKLFTTRCVHAELKTLGQSHSDSLRAAQDLHIARCEHVKRRRGDACIKDVIGENNDEHFFVGTQDRDLQNGLRETVATPIIFVRRNAVLLEQPSKMQKDRARNSEEQRLLMSDAEQKALRSSARSMLLDEDSDGSSEIDDDVEMPSAVKRHASRKETYKDRPQFKRKKAKGPNPLSCKRKKAERNSVSVPEGGNIPDPTVDDKSRQRSRKRKRRHNRKNEPGAYV